MWRNLNFKSPYLSCLKQKRADILRLNFFRIVSFDKSPQFRVKKDHVFLVCGVITLEVKFILIVALLLFFSLVWKAISRSLAQC